MAIDGTITKMLRDARRCMAICERTINHECSTELLMLIMVMSMVQFAMLCGRLQ